MSCRTGGFRDRAHRTALGHSRGRDEQPRRRHRQDRIQALIPSANGWVPVGIVCSASCQAMSGATMNPMVSSLAVMT